MTSIAVIAIVVLLIDFVLRQLSHVSTLTDGCSYVPLIFCRLGRGPPVAQSTQTTAGCVARPCSCFSPSESLDHRSWVNSMLPDAVLLSVNSDHAELKISVLCANRTGHWQGVLFSSPTDSGVSQLLSLFTDRDSRILITDPNLAHNRGLAVLYHSLKGTAKPSTLVPAGPAKSSLNLSILTKGSVFLSHFLLASEIILVDGQVTYSKRPLSVSSPGPQRDSSCFSTTAENPETEAFNADNESSHIGLRTAGCLQPPSFNTAGDNKPPITGPSWTGRQAPECSVLSSRYFCRSKGQATSTAADTVECLPLYLIAWFTRDRLWWSYLSENRHCWGLSSINAYGAI
jgi:hypothetical protein